MSETIGIMGGELGSFHHIAALQFFGEDAKVVPLGPPRQVLERLRRREVKKAVLAISNNNDGNVQNTLRLLSPPLREVPDTNGMHESRGNIWIAGETYVAVRHQLVGIASIPMSEIDVVYSHPAAFDQCSILLEGAKEHGGGLAHAERVEQLDTSSAARKVTEQGNPTHVAIASEKAAEIHRLEVIRADIQDDPENYTRFLVLTDPEEEANMPESANKTTLTLRTPNKPGALYEAIRPLHDEGVDIREIHSRIIKGSDFKVDFLIELRAGLNDLRVQHFLGYIGALGCKATILGSYIEASVPR
jgi:prephenate dehydratase